MTLTTVLLQAQPGNGSGLGGILMIIAMIAIFWLFMIRPQSKKQKELKKQRENMKNGDKVVTAGGIHGRIKDIKESVILIDIANGVCIKVDKGSVYPIVENQPAK